jgi:hypothetical protein
MTPKEALEIILPDLQAIESAAGDTAHQSAWSVVGYSGRFRLTMWHTVKRREVIDPGQWEPSLDAYVAAEKTMTVRAVPESEHRAVHEWHFDELVDVANEGLAMLLNRPAARVRNPDRVFLVICGMKRDMDRLITNAKTPPRPEGLRG